ncbi:transposase [Salinigranum salinum]|uniref:transposase n=1 Tax=Salinigranum salinum TaxID=1364937 RepID=UPI0012606783|nr:transposase [Salinigranum salinum]
MPTTGISRRKKKRSDWSDVTDPTERPKRCPECGSSDVRERRETGGGWRKVFRCAACGRQVAPDDV